MCLHTVHLSGTCDPEMCHQDSCSHWTDERNSREREEACCLQSLFSLLLLLSEKVSNTWKRCSHPNLAMVLPFHTAACYVKPFSQRLLRKRYLKSTAVSFWKQIITPTQWLKANLYLKTCNWHHWHFSLSNQNVKNRWNPHRKIHWILTFFHIS